MSFCPLAIAKLTTVDWEAIDRKAAESVADPLFGGKTDIEYQALHDQILRLAG